MISVWNNCFQASKLKARSKSYTRLNVSSTNALKKSEEQESKLKSKSISTITEIYRQHGSFRILEQEEGSADKEQVLFTKKGVAVPSLNYWLQKPDKPTIPSPGSPISTMLSYDRQPNLHSNQIWNLDGQ